jgi:hypothetical protein
VVGDAQHHRRAIAVTESDRAGPEQQPPEPTWDQKVLQLHEGLRQRDIPYAFGGAIALNYHREPRSTLDINVFVTPDQESAVLAALVDVYRIPDQERIEQELREQGQTRTLWGATYVDLFLANTDFHTSMAERIERQPFGDAEIPVLSIEDLLICKVLFDRPKDWVDIDAVAATRRSELDGHYMLAWLGQFLEPDDPKLERIQSVLSREA